MITKVRKLRKLEDELWKDIPNYKYYQISNYGRVKSFNIYKKEGRILKCSEINGFMQVGLAVNGKQDRYYIHKLVADVWHTKPSDKHIFVTHLDENLLNNHISNLEWHTKETLLERHRKLKKEKYNNPENKKVRGSSKLCVSDVMLLKSMLERGVVQAKIAKMFCISEMQVTRIKRGENWAGVKAKGIDD